MRNSGFFCNASGKKQGDVRPASERAAGEVVASDAAAVVTERPFGVPHEESPPRSGHSLTGSPPVVMRPVASVRIHVEHDVVDEVVDMSSRRFRPPRSFAGYVRGSLQQGALEFIPLRHVTLAEFTVLSDDVPLRLTAVPRVEKVAVDAFGGVIVALGFEPLR